MSVIVVFDSFAKRYPAAHRVEMNSTGFCWIIFFYLVLPLVLGLDPSSRYNWPNLISLIIVIDSNRSFSHPYSRSDLIEFKLTVNQTFNSPIFVVILCYYGWLAHQKSRNQIGFSNLARASHSTSELFNTDSYYQFILASLSDWVTQVFV